MTSRRQNLLARLPAALSAVALTVAVVVSAVPPAAAEPRISTSATRLVEIAPWPAWYVGLAIFALFLFPAAGIIALRRLGVTQRSWLLGVIGLGFLHGLSGYLILEIIFLGSVGCMNTSPWVFVGAWLAGVLILSLVYAVLALQRWRCGRQSLASATCNERGLR